MVTRGRYPVQAAALLLGLVLSSAAAAQQPAAALAPIDWAAVDAALGKTGVMMAGDVHRVGFPRTDVRVTVGAVTVKPALALGSWAAFKQTGDHEAMVMGDLVLLENEIQPVAARLQGVVHPMALHNHILRETPRVMYMHIMGRGAPLALAQAIRAALDLTATPLGSTPAPVPGAAGPTIDTAQVSAILGYHGTMAGGVYQLGVPRAESIVMDGVEIPPSMGLATAINFQPTGEGRAAITGDFVMIGSEVEAVMAAIKAHGLDVTAMHHHLIGETPRLYFMHFWAEDDAVKLARALRTGLDQMNVKR